MKLKISILFATIFVAHLSYGQITDPSPYCLGGYDEGPAFVPHYISNVTLGALNNTTGDTEYAGEHYVYYNNIVAPDLVAGNTYTLSVSHDTGSLHFVAVYIDYNQNNSFYDTGERVLQQGGGTTSTAPITYPSVSAITIPTTAKPGITRMRVLAFEDDYYTYYNENATPCTDDTLNWGETEDYNINILASTGIPQINKNNTTLFYPNPVNNIIYVDDCMRGAEITIYNLEGKIVRHGSITNSIIDVSDFIPGQYIIKAISNRNVYTQLLIITKQ